MNVRNCLIYGRYTLSVVLKCDNPFRKTTLKIVKKMTLTVLLHFREKTNSKSRSLISSTMS